MASSSMPDNESTSDLVAIALAAKALENQLDAAISQLDNLDDKDLVALRRKRLEELKRLEKDKQEWLACGHGQYTELSSDKELFEAGTRSKRLVVQFYLCPTERCQILDRHLTILARKHLECRFCKVNVQKAPFTVKRLNVRVMPTLVLFVEGKTVEFLRGFDGFGGTDDFTTETVEWRLSRSGVINHPGNLGDSVREGASRRGIRASRASDSESD
uniref:Thioredoxin domain-containing protein 9 n=1 Tax=Trichuris muris TaxID=70415 RepID=A0A5S6Q539_TRIMR